jgi:hypothetical protein
MLGQVEFNVIDVSVCDNLIVSVFAVFKMGMKLGKVALALSLIFLCVSRTAELRHCE